MPGSSASFGWPFPLPTDRLADGAAVIGSFVQALDGMIIPGSSKPASDLQPTYPLGFSTMAVSAPWAPTGGWMGMGQVITFRRGGGDWALQLFVLNSITAPRLYMRHGSNGAWSGWHTVAGNPLPDAMAANNVVITPAANSTASAAVVFPSNRFTDNPRITATPLTTTPNSAATGVNNVTANGFTMYLYRTTATSTTIHWTAVQMDAGL